MKYLNYLLVILFIFIINISYSQNTKCLSVLFDEPVIICSADFIELQKLKFVRENIDLYLENEGKKPDNPFKQFNFDIKKDFYSISYAMPLKNLDAFLNEAKDNYLDTNLSLKYGYYVFNAKCDIQKFIDFLKVFEINFVKNDNLYIYEDITEDGDLNKNYTYVIYEDFLIYTGSINKESLLNNLKNKANNQSSNTFINKLIKDSFGISAFSFININDNIFIKKVIKDFINDTLFVSYSLRNEEKFKTFLNAFNDVTIISAGAITSIDNASFAFSLYLNNIKSAEIIKDFLSDYIKSDEFKSILHSYLTNVKVELKDKTVILKFKLSAVILEFIAKYYDLLYNP